MNRIKMNSGRVMKGVLAFFLFFGENAAVMAKENLCWAEFYEYAQYIGEKLRLEGPIKLPSLRNVNGENWESRIDSLVVGPKAKVVIYENPNFKLTLTEMAEYPQLMKSLGITEEDIRQESEMVFNGNAKSHHLGEFNFHKKTKSLKIDCVR
ncbi:MAG: beta/gamma crystallin domain-containing protein [Gammaproteobacteria bacterium]